MISLEPKCIFVDCLLLFLYVLSAGLSPHLSEDQEHTNNLKDQEASQMPATAARRRARISFEDYHSTWAGIATSKTNTDYTAPCKEEQQMGADARVSVRWKKLVIIRRFSSILKEIHTHTYDICTFCMYRGYMPVVPCGLTIASH